MLLRFGNLPVPWNATWSGEAHYEVRPCRWVEGRPAMWQPHAPGCGRPIFAKPHFVRQRQSVARFLCTVCGSPTPPRDRWWFGHGERRQDAFEEEVFMTNEAPVHHACATVALANCPHLRGRDDDLMPFPKTYKLAVSMLGGEATERDFNLHLGDRRIVGALKFVWPSKSIVYRSREKANSA